jgi:hypothetical protein
LVARSEREILVVEEQRDPLFLIHTAEGTLTSRINVVRSRRYPSSSPVHDRRSDIAEGQLLSVGTPLRRW